jgi:hypothetical protein
VFDDVMVIMDRFGRAVIVEGTDLDTMFPTEICSAKLPSQLFATAFVASCYQTPGIVSRATLIGAWERCRYIFDVTQSIVAFGSLFSDVAVRFTKHCTDAFVAVVAVVDKTVASAAEIASCGSNSDIVVSLRVWGALTEVLGSPPFEPEMFLVIGHPKDARLPVDKWRENVESYRKNADKAR